MKPASLLIAMSRMVVVIGAWGSMTFPHARRLGSVTKKQKKHSSPSKQGQKLEHTKRKKSSKHPKAIKKEAMLKRSKSLNSSKAGESSETTSSSRRNDLPTGDPEETIPTQEPTTDRSGLSGITWQGSVFEIDPNSGFMSFVGDSGFSRINSGASTRDGKLLTTDDAHIIELDPLSGAGSIYLTFNLEDTPELQSYSVRGLACDSQNRLWAVWGRTGSSGNILAQVDSSTGRVKIVQLFDFIGIQALAFDSGDKLYGAHVHSSSLLDLGSYPHNTIERWISITPSFGGQFQSLEFDALTGDFWTVNHNGHYNFVRVDASTGNATFIGSTGGHDIRGMFFV